MSIFKLYKRGSRPQGEAGDRSNIYKKETAMNEVQVTGYIKNVQERGSGNYKVITANLSQRNDEGKCVFTMPLVFTNSDTKNALANVSWIDGVSQVVTLTGKLVTRFDRRPGIDNAERRAPYTQIEVVSVN